MTLSEIKKDCQKKMKQAMNDLHVESTDIINDSFDAFYAQGNPRRQRTGTLPGAKYVPEPTFTDTSSYMEVGYEGDQISYQDGTFIGGEVLGATMTGTYGVVGDSSYDEKAFEEIEKAIDKNFSKYFR